METDGSLPRSQGGAHHWSVSWARCIQSTPSYSPRSIPILSSIYA